MAESTSTHVIDSSFILCYLMPDETNPIVQEVFDRYKKGGIKFIATHLLPFEIASGLYAATLSKRIEKSLAQKLMSEFLEFPIGLESVDFAKLLAYAQKCSISVYDASYLVLAKTLNIPLLTLDKKLEALA